ncbi:type II toxin-antitoxin system RelE/ParE family toxin [Candidatus Pacearchaeota archaeon]|nr:type II toxin-antitoxin system RelE/ParE family toxin [Candidatus Pacearchaeota archaeon]
MYEITLKSKAEKFLSKLDNSIAKQIIQKIKQLSANPRIGKPLIGNMTGLWRLRVDKYRIIYQIIENKLIVLVLDIGHRKNIY